MEEKADALSEVAPAMSEVSKQTTSQIKTAKPGKNPGRVVARKKISRTPCLALYARQKKTKDAGSPRRAKRAFTTCTESDSGRLKAYLIFAIGSLAVSVLGVN